MADNKVISKPVKSIFMKAYVSALDSIDNAEKKYQDTLKQPQKVSGEDFLKIVIDLALAKAQMDHLQDAYTSEGGGKFSFSN